MNEVSGRRDVVGQTSDRRRVTSHIILLPLAEEAHKVVALKASVQDLTEEVQVRDEGSLQNDRDVRSIEELDREGSLVASHTL